jgi:hypothetical protein
MAHVAFKRVEAQAKIGMRVSTRVAVVRIPRDAVGTVTRVDRGAPWVDWWTKAEYDAHLAELPSRGGAR